MRSKIHAIYPKARQPVFANPAGLILFHRELSTAVRMVGEQMEQKRGKVWEGKSLDGEHVMSANDLEATALIIRCVTERLSKSGLTVEICYLTEELSLVPYAANGRNGSGNGSKPMIVLHIDPIDGSKAFDNWKCEADCPLPRPPSAVSVAALCPATGEIVVSALYCFDLGEVFSSIYLGGQSEGEATYAAFRNGTLLNPIARTFQWGREIEAKRRVLCGNYNSKALVDIARMELELMKRGLKPTFGGLSGSSATDIVNVVRGSFSACIDVRALCQQGGSKPYWYDVAGGLPIARGRDLSVIVTNAQGQALHGGNHPIYQPVAFVVARPEIEAAVVEVIRCTICPAFLADEAIESYVAAEA